MAKIQSFEKARLSAAEKIITAYEDSCKSPSTFRLEILEELAARTSGILESDYRNITGFARINEITKSMVDDVEVAIGQAGIPLSVALSSLSRVELDDIEIKKNGSVYTDFRLAKYLAKSVMHNYSVGKIIDPACGSSIVLAAIAEEYSILKDDVEGFVSNSLFGVDLSIEAIRGSLLSLSTFLSNPEQLERLASHFICANSLYLDSDGICSSFGVPDFEYVVGNPPWERVKPSRNEYARTIGINANYGEEIRCVLDGFEQHRINSTNRAKNLAVQYGLAGGVDLYRAFLNLNIKLCASDGSLCLYLPAGLIRSKTLAQTRSFLMEHYAKVGISVFSNRSKFFEIDSRFKFVLLFASRKRNAGSHSAVELQYCSADDESVYRSSRLMLEPDFFSDKSGELGAPEVRSSDELDLLKTIWHHSDRMFVHSEFGKVRPVRELDMTLDKALFLDAQTDGCIPIIEGRMVSQYRCGAKSYVSGSGRSAVWRNNPLGLPKLKPHYYIDPSSLSSDKLKRVSLTRVGYCDIAGQTNERAMQAAIIPAGIICGNKVPTIFFESRDTALLWLGIVNSFAFDWVLRRYITTTINHFILLNMPLPHIATNDLVATSIIENVERIISIEEIGKEWSFRERWDYATRRAAIDSLVLQAYGISWKQFELIVEDFPLVDRAFKGKGSPTFSLLKGICLNNEELIESVKAACRAGAAPYIQNEQYLSEAIGGRK